MKNVSLGMITDRIRGFGHFLYAHDRVIYIVLFLSVLIGTIIGLNLALNQPSDEAYRGKKMNEAQSARFDTATIEKIRNLNARQQTATDALPAGVRSNPFGE
jgi:hypothetical protein